MEKRIAQIISAVFHPLLVPTYAFALLFSMPVYFSLVLTPQARLTILGLVFLTTGFFPAIFIYFMLKRKIISSIHLTAREERTFPYMVTIIFFYVTFYLLKKLEIPAIFYYFAAAATLLVVLTLMINVFWKISSHMVSVGGVFGLLIGLSLFLRTYFSGMIILLALLAGIIGFARLKMNAHNPAQVYTGFFLGAVVTSILFIIQI